MIPADEHFFAVESRLKHDTKQIKRLRALWLWEPAATYSAGNYKKQLLLSQFFRSVGVRATGLTVVSLLDKREGDLVTRDYAIRNWPGNRLLFMRLLSGSVDPYSAAVFLELLRQDQEDSNA